MIKFIHHTISTPASNVFSTNVPNGVTRKILAILISAQHDTGIQRYTISKVNSNNTTTVFIDSIPVEAAKNVTIPPLIDKDKPILILGGGENLSAVKDNVTDAEMTVWYVDEPML